MIETPLRTDWATLKRRIQETHPELGDDDFPPATAHPEEIVWHLQRRLNTDIDTAQAIYEAAHTPPVSNCPSE